MLVPISKGSHLVKNPDSVVIPLGAKRLESRLRYFQQWSELSGGHPTTEQLFASCKLNAKGEVDSPASITELIAESYTACALVYLHCRLFRYVTARLRSSRTCLHLRGTISY
jgi:hypothetical protein